MDCPRTLLLAQRVSVEWRACISASAKLQKKFYFVPSTIEEAIALNMVRDNSIVTSIGPGETVIWNELLITDLVGFDDCNGLNYKLPDGIIRDTISARRGLSSWERMYFSVRSGDIKPAFLFEADLCDVFRKRDDLIDRIDTDFDYFQDKARAVLDVVENKSWKQFQAMVLWPTAVFDFYDWSMPFRDYKRLHSLEQRFGNIRWDDIQASFDLSLFQIDSIPMEQYPRDRTVFPSNTKKETRNVTTERS